MYEAEYGRYKQEQPEQIQEVTNEKACRVGTNDREQLRCIGTSPRGNRDRNQIDERLDNEADTSKCTTEISGVQQLFPYLLSFLLRMFALGAVPRNYREEAYVVWVPYVKKPRYNQVGELSTCA